MIDANSYKIVAHPSGRPVAIAVDDDAACWDEHDGWICSLLPGHSGDHEAWCTEPTELMTSWPQQKKARRR